jgi:hypothetical protein
MMAIRNIQWFLGRNIGPRRALCGLDALIWGSTSDPHSHASDIIQVVDQTNPSAMSKFFRDKIVLWAPRFPSWLWIVFFWSKKRPDTLRHFSFSARAFEVASMAIGNFAASLLIYAAITSLYFTAGKAASIVGVVVIALVITVCSVLFRNQQFISMLATYVKSTTYLAQPD